MEHDRKHEAVELQWPRVGITYYMLGITIGVYRICKDILKHIKQHNKLGARNQC